MGSLRGPLFYEPRPQERVGVCPACLRGDTSMQLTPDAMVKAYGRALWVMASARVCPVHKLALVPPTEDTTKHEFPDAWLPWMFEVMECDLDQDIDAGGLLEDHIVRRLRGECPEGWARSFPLGALGAICETLGVSLIHGRDGSSRKLNWPSRHSLVLNCRMAVRPKSLRTSRA